MIKTETPHIDNSTINSLENWTEIFGIELNNDKNLNLLMDYIEVRNYIKRVGYEFILESDQLRWTNVLN